MVIKKHSNYTTPNFFIYSNEKYTRFYSNEKYIRMETSKTIFGLIKLFGLNAVSEFLKRRQRVNAFQLLKNFTISIIGIAHR